MPEVVMDCACILNPAAGSGAAARQREALDAALRRAGYAPDWFVSASPEALADEVARAAAAPVLFVVGGDGTLHRVGNVLKGLGASPDLGIISFGTGNDYVRSLGLPRDPFRAIARMPHLQAVPVDGGRVRWRGPAGEGTRYFLNVSGVGFDAHVAGAASRLRPYLGRWAYAASVLTALRGRPEPVLRVREGTWEAPGRVLFEGVVLFVSAANGAYAGGGMQLAPGADLRDGVLDLVIIRAASAMRILSVLPRAFRGRHESAPEVCRYRLPAFHVQSSIPLPLHADGEGLTLRATDVEFSVIPAAWNLFAA
ncbi:MAG: diacylglycerol kinase [Rhodothermaceae bacterium]|nr:MAG: diacylglycerol kinase [Rhodothermaceae bacterium]